MSRFLRALVLSAVTTAAAYAASVAVRSRRSAPRSRRVDAGDSHERSPEDSLTDEETRVLLAELAQQV